MVTKNYQAWASAHIALSPGAPVHHDILDQIIEWTRGDPRFIDKQENGMAHVQWTIQLRFDPLGDEGKKEFVTAAVMKAASFILAKANLIEGPILSTIAVYSDDFMKARKQIELIPDTLGAALDAFGGDDVQEGLSAEMQEVVSGINTRKRK